MPRGKKVSVAERAAWLEEYEKGTPTRTIAARWHRDVSTVMRSLPEARRQRDERAVREGRLREAAHAHDEDILGAAEALLQWASKSSGDEEPQVDRRTARLLRGLRQHDPRSALWPALDGLRASNRGIREAEGKVRTVARSYVGKKLKKLLGDTQNLYLESFEKAALDRAIGTEREAVGDALLHYRDEAAEGGVRPIWNALLLVRNPVTPAAAAAIRRTLAGLLQEAPTWEAARQLRESLVERQRQRDKIEEAVDILVLRRVASGRCDLCPV